MHSNFLFLWMFYLGSISALMAVMCLWGALALRAQRPYLARVTLMSSGAAMVFGTVAALAL